MEALILRVAVLSLYMIVLGAHVASAGVDVDAVGYVVEVVDGDTVRVRLDRVYDLLEGAEGSIVRVRLADIDAPELGTIEGYASKLALEDMVLGRVVALDVDDLGVFDRYGRVVAVIYVQLNETHAVNVNYLLVKLGHATIWDHWNEFNPGEWEEVEELRIEGPQGRSIYTYAVIALIILGLLLALSRKVK